MGVFYTIWSYAVYTFWFILPSNLRPEGFLSAVRMHAETSAQESNLRKIARILRIVLHIAVVLLICWILWEINHGYDLERVLRSPWTVLHRAWLPGLFLLLYAMVWSGWWILRMLGQEAEAESFPDIEDAWNETQKALARAGLDPTEVPLFLVLGQPKRAVEDLFTGADLAFRVHHEPADPDAPLHVYGGPSGIFVTSEGISLLGRASYLLSHEAGEEASFQPESLDKALTEPVASTTNGANGTGEAKEAAAATLLLEEEEAQAHPAPQRRLFVLQNADEVERRTARLRFLCRLIVRRRQPYCPLNGILVLIPAAATVSAAEAAQTGALCHQDLATVRQTLQVHCPVQLMVCDLETIPGFGELLARLPDEKQRRQLFGRRFPLLPRLTDAEVPGMLDSGVKWLCGEMISTLAFRLLHTESAQTEDVQEIVRSNARLVRFLGEWNRRQGNLSKILVQGLVPEPGEPVLLGGCYLAATGADAARQQGFIAGVFRLLLETQNYVFWTRQANLDERHYRRLTYATYTAAALMAIGGVVLAVFVWYGP